MLTSSSAIVLGTRYRLGPLLGQGASGAVFEALDLMLGRQVAIKCMILPEGMDVAERANEFVREAQTLARLDHPHIVDIHDAGLDESGRPYFVMALVDRSLRDVLIERGPLGLEELLALFLPLCGALACAHDLGIIHCDLKPENIAVHRVGGAGLRGKLLDFSIARRSGSEVSSPFVLGTPGYMAPEQIQGTGCGPCTDVWALAAVAFECLTGRPPFEADDTSLLLKRTVHESPPSLAEFAPSLAVPVVLAIDRALARSPDRRYPDMRAFAQALVSAAAQALVRVPDDPDPIGLPDMQRWRLEGLVTTARLPVAARPVAAPAGAATSRLHVESSAPAAPNTEARSSEPLSRHARSRRRLRSLSGLTVSTVCAGCALGALWLTTRPSLRSRADEAHASTAHARGVPALPTVHVGASGLAPTLRPVAATLRSRAEQPSASTPPATAPVVRRAEPSLAGSSADEPPASLRREEPPEPAPASVAAQAQQARVARATAAASAARSSLARGAAAREHAGGHRGATRALGSAPQRENDTASDASSSTRGRPAGEPGLAAALRSRAEQPRAPTEAAPVAVDLELKRDWEW